MPTAFLFLCLFYAVNQRSHSLVVVTVGFHHVYYIESICTVLSSVRNSEKVPLAIPRRPIIVLKIKIIFSVSYFNGAAEITRFKPRLKY